MSSSPFAGLAGLARKALQTTAITPRLPSRYESRVAAQPGADWAFDGEATPTGPPAVAAVPGGPVANQAEPVLSALPPSTVDARSTGTAALRAASEAPVLGARAPAAASGSRRQQPAAALLADPDADEFADAVAVRRAPSVARPPSLNLAAAQVPPQDWLADPEAAHSRGASPPDGVSVPAQASALMSAQSSGRAQALRERIAQQVPRLQDEAGAAPSWAPPRAGAEPLAVPTVALNTRQASPSVEITIGSIAITLTQAPVAAPARAAVPPADPAVQSLDAYLQARQRRGGA